MPARASRCTRNPDYWGRDLAVNRGFWNFDEIRFDYYRDANSYHEAFKKGLFDLRKENDPGRWQTGYDFPGAARRPRRQGELHLRPAEAELRLRLQHAPRRLRRHPRARGDRAAVRFRMGEPLDLLRSLPAQRELFRGLGALRARPAGRCARARPARALPGCRARRRARRHLGAAGDRRLGPRPRRSCAARSRCFAAAGYELRGTELRRTPQRPAAQLRDHGHGAQRRRDEERLALLFAAQLKRAGIAARVRAGRCRTVRDAANRLRFRHDPEPLGPVALARQRAGLLLELGRRRQQWQPQLHGRQEPGGRRHDRRAAQGADASPRSSRRCARSTAC